MARGAIVVLALLLTNSCASFSTTPVEPRNIVAQRADKDCTVASLAMATGLPYEVVLAAFAAEHIEVTEGALDMDVLMVAADLHLILIPVSKYSPTDSGVIAFTWDSGKRHMVYTRHGWIFDPGGSMASPFQDYLDHMPIAGIAFFKQVR